MKIGTLALRIYGIVALIGILAGTGALIWQGWQWLFAYLVVVNILTLAYYGWDKSISHTTLMRIPEKLLHSLALLGGSPAALLGQRLFRHKTVKTSFQIVYWMIVIIQAGLLFWLYGSGY